jgi:DNA-binding GntR family transcriptional regulator
VASVSTEQQPAVTTEAGVAAYRQLRDAIVSGRFQPNERLVESDLAGLLHVGRATVRAALVRLDQEGLVVREPNRGARVRLVSEKEALQIEEIRSALEQLMARHAAERITRADVRDLRAVHEEMRRRVESGDPLGYSELNARFHQRIWHIADQEVAAELLTSLRSQAIRFQYRTILEPGRPQRSLAEHEAIVEALARADPERAENAMRTHLSHVVETLQQAIARQHAAGGRPGP